MTGLTAIRKAAQKLEGWIIARSFWILSTLAIVLAIFSSGLPLLLTKPMSNLVLVGTIIESESFITIVVACYASIIPIVFSVSTLAIQHAASNYTASILENYKKDCKTWFFYGFLFFGLLFASIMLFTRSDILLFLTEENLIRISLLNAALVILFFSLILLPFQLTHVADLINPRQLVTRARERCTNEIISTPKNVDSMHEKTKAGNQLEARIAKLPFYREFLFHENFGSLLPATRQGILQIMDVVLKSAVKREAETYEFGFKAISEIAQTYVSIRRDDSTSEDKLLQYVYEKLLSIPKMALDTEDVALLHAVITAFEGIGCATAEIKPASRWGPNLMTSLAIGYIRGIGAKAIERSLWDSVADAMRSIKNIGVSAIRKIKDDGLASKKILELSMKAIGRREWFVINVASGVLNDLLTSSVNARADVDHVPARVLEAVEQLSTAAIDNGLEWHALTGLFPAMPEYSIERVAWTALQFKNELHPDSETAYREGYAWEMISSLLDALTKIGVKAAQKKSSMLLVYVAQPMHRIALVLMNEKSVALKDSFDPQVCTVVTALASMFMQAGDCPLIDEIADALIDIAFQSLDVGKGAIASHVVEAISEMSLRMMSWDRYGYDSQRLAGRLGVIGSYAINASDTIVAKACANGLVQFDKAYRQKYRGSKDRRHFGEMQELHDREGIEEWAVSYKKTPQRALDQFTALYTGAKKSSMTGTRGSRERGDVLPKSSGELRRN